MFANDSNMNVITTDIKSITFGHTLEQMIKIQNYNEGTFCLYD